MIARTFDAGVINRLANHPSIFPWVSVPGQDSFDLTGALEDANNYALVVDGGGFFFQRLEPGLYEAHSLFLPEMRGAKALQAARDAMRFMFENTDCHTILARCPKGNLPVLAFTRALKFEFSHTEKDAWPTQNGPVDQRWFRMSRGRWEFLQEN